MKSDKLATITAITTAVYKTGRKTRPILTPQEKKAVISESLYSLPRATTTHKYKVVGSSTSRAIAILSRIRMMTVVPGN
jgi:hypothetical protein